MNIEIKNFYPFERDDEKQLLKGGLHVAIKLGDFELNIRSIVVTKRKAKWFFRLPFKNGTDHKTGEPVIYPVVIFSNADHNKVLLDAIYTKGPGFIEDFLKTHPQAQEMKIAVKTPQVPSDQKEVDMDLFMQKKAPSPQPVLSPASIAKKTWSDPPPKKQNKLGAGVNKKIMRGTP